VTDTDSVEDVLELLSQDVAHYDLRVVKDYSRIESLIAAIKARGDKVVLTSGSFDLLHQGHSMYLEAAKELGDFLVVGVDSDEKIRRRKGVTRPAVPEDERLRMVTHQRGVGLVALKNADDDRWALIRAVRPDVLVATEETYSPEEISELESAYCGRVEVLRRMATISTSARLRLVYLDLAATLADRLPAFIREVVGEMAGSR
jgi:D-beta-D-heptose 7-phosphate kinase/D-beta-D-heptose 1-phosphate adenosyltransferase